MPSICIYDIEEFRPFTVVKQHEKFFCNNVDLEEEKMILRDCLF